MVINQGKAQVGHSTKRIILCNCKNSLGVAKLPNSARLDSWGDAYQWSWLALQSSEKGPSYLYFNLDRVTIRNRKREEPFTPNRSLIGSACFSPENAAKAQF